jgi:hypothetical protein
MLISLAFASFSIDIFKRNSLLLWSIRTLDLLCVSAISDFAIFRNATLGRIGSHEELPQHPNLIPLPDLHPTSTALLPLRILLQSTHNLGPEDTDGRQAGLIICKCEMEGNIAFFSVW